MNLSRKIVLFNVTLLTLVATLGGVSLWNVSTLWRATRASVADYDLADRARVAGTEVGWLRKNISGADGATYRDAKYLLPIQTEVTAIAAEIQDVRHPDDADSANEFDLAQSISTELHQATHDLSGTSPAAAAGAPDVADAQLQRLENALASLSKLAPDAARRHLTLAAASLQGRFVSICIWLVLVLSISTFVHFRQYRALVRPLLWLRDDMRSSAGRAYREPVRSQGDGEFREVAGYFNGLARELADLYRGLEEKVIARSKELVRSERLASVGFLAAGVAHEINNPLSIVSGYAELAERDLRRLIDVPCAGSNASETELEAEAHALSRILEAQEIIREEAFRCKEITSRLLSLSRAGSDEREPLRMDEVARQVSTLIKGLKNYRARKVVLDFPPAEELDVIANPTEMKQVVLNLLVNALEAASAERGEVRMGGRREGKWVELFVQDNGKGMSPEMLEQIFEPFFTAKRGSNNPGTGLGLSITHAIIENHQGRIRAESDGPGRGSRFIIRLPAVAKSLIGATNSLESDPHRL